MGARAGRPGDRRADQSPPRTFSPSWRPRPMRNTRRPSTSCSSRASRSSPACAGPWTRRSRTCVATVAEVADAAAARGLGVMCSGTHPTTDWTTQQISPNPRYAKLVEDMQWLARRLQIFGVHVHVGVRSPEKAIPIVNALTAYIPHFLALSASSPYWVGTDTGLASARSKVFEGLPTAGLPYQLVGLGRLRALHGDLDLGEHHQLGARGVVGRPAASGLRDGGAADLRRPADAVRDLVGGRDVPVPGRDVQRPARPRATPCRCRRAGRSARTSGGPPGTASRPS